MPTTTPPATPTPSVNGQVVALAHYASRAALEAALARTGTTFNQSVALRSVADNGGTVERARVEGRLTGALKIAESAAAETVDELIERKMLETPAAGQVSFTDSGRELFEGISASGSEIAARVYAGIPAEDLAVAGRVLALVTERANAELAGA
jgi:DNA-binding MarR family transcriptional regulator